MTAVVSRACGVVILALAVGVLVVPQPSPNAYDRVVATLIAAVLFGLTLLARRAAALPDVIGRVLGSWGWVAGWVLLAAASGMASIYPTDSWDPGMIRLLSASTPGQWGQSVLAYAERYPNNLGIVAVGQVLQRTFGSAYAQAFVAFNVVSFAVAAVALRAVLRRVSGSIAGCGVAALGILVGLSPWLSVAYVDAASLWAPILAVHLALTAQQSRRRLAALALWLCAGLVCAAGTLLRTTPLLAAAGIALWLLLGVARRVDARRAVSGLVVFALALGVGVQGGRAALTALSGYPNRPATAVSSLVHVAMGLSSSRSSGGRVSYGGYDVALDKATYGQSAPVQDRIAADYIDARLAELGPLGTLDFLARKNLYTWGDASFFAFGEGSDIRTQPVQQVAPFDAFNSASGPWRYGWTSVLNGVWLGLLLLLGWGLVVGRPRRDAVLLALVVVAVVVFLTGFQTRSRYVFAFVPVVIAAAGLALPGRRPAPETTPAVPPVASETTAGLSESVAPASEITVRDADIAAVIAVEAGDAAPRPDDPQRLAPSSPDAPA